MFCEKCGEEISEGSYICSNCGNKVLSAINRQEEIWRIKVEPAKCVGCELCSSYCAYDHTGSAISSRSAIKINPKWGEWKMGQTSILHDIDVCEQCPGIAPCMEVCPIPEAMERDEETGAVTINQEICNSCKSCVKACPYDAIYFSERNSMIIKCDLCGGEPICVEVCPVDALSYEKVR